MIIVQAECLQSPNWITSHIPALAEDPLITTTVLREAAGGEGPSQGECKYPGQTGALSAPLILRCGDKAQSLIQQSGRAEIGQGPTLVLWEPRHHQRLEYNEEKKIRANIPPISHPSLSLLCVTYDVSVNTNHVALNLNTWLPQVRITGDTNTLTTVIIRPPAQTNIITHSDKMVIQIRDGS